MNFDFTDDQQAIKRTANEFLAARFTAERRRELAEAGEYDDGIWREMSELGWPGIFVAEEHGGQELGTTELAILSEELGYALAPSPFLSNAAAGLLIAYAGSEEQQAKWLPGVASGEAPGTVGFVSDGAAPLVPDAAQASTVEHGAWGACPLQGEVEVLVVEDGAHLVDGDGGSREQRRAGQRDHGRDGCVVHEHGVGHGSEQRHPGSGDHGGERRHRDPADATPRGER